MKTKKKNPQVTLRRSDVERIKRECTNDAVNRAFAIFLLIMHDKWGFGAARMNRLLKQITELSNTVEDGYVTIEKIKKTLQEEVGLVF